MTRRLHLAGSASMDCDPELLRWTHKALRELLDLHLANGGTVLAQLGADPRTGEGLSILFDWLVIEAAAEALERGDAEASRAGALLTVRGSQRGLSQIPEDRRPAWDFLVERDAVDMKLLPETWRSGALIRLAQAQVGDLLLIASGGTGVEHLADLYHERGRAVLPWKIDLGSSGGDGVLGGVGLADKAISDAGPFVRLASGAGAEARLADLAVDPGQLGDPVQAGRALAGFLERVERPRAFYVRLMRRDHEKYEMVDSFFRDVVDKAIEELGYRGLDLGVEEQEAAWMNAEIFERLHHSELVFVDLTGMRANCLLELGYALGNHQGVCLTVNRSEALPFDADKLPAFIWNEEAEKLALTEDLKAHFAQYGQLPRLVEPAGFV